MRATKKQKPSQKNFLAPADNFDLPTSEGYSQRQLSQFWGFDFRMDQSREITRLLREWSNGRRSAFDELMPLVYGQLHRQAARYLRDERRCQTLQTTALINDAWIRLVDQTGIEWQSRNQFFAFSAKVMRHILVDHARAKHREKRGGDAVKVPLEEALMLIVDEQDVDLIALDEALNRLAAIDQQQVRLVELRYFSGLSLEEAAEALKISRATAARDWNVARAWLHRELTRSREAFEK
jgi:RNA polymerase sigma factor (TIGR02999 family)